MAVPFILAIAADNAGCGYHRCQSPAYWIAKSGAALANSVLGYPTLDKLREMKPNVIVCQRPRDEREVAVLKSIRAEFGNNIKILFEIDDLLTDVPEENVHEAFQPPPDEVDHNIAEALNSCDWAIASSEPIAAWLRRLRPQTDVKVLGNFIEEGDHMDLPKIQAPAAGAKPRIGWGGSISHDGDLDIIIDAVKSTGPDACTWVFLGHKPRMDYQNVDMQEIGGVPPAQYFGLLASQGLELMLAPLEDNAFNDAKTNLKIVQAGLVGAAVIATPTRPYLDGKPPVFAYATTPDDYAKAVNAWLALPDKKKIWHRARMRRWAKKYSVNNNIHTVKWAWGVADVPTLAAPKRINGKLVVAAAEGTVKLGEKSREGVLYEPDFAKATRLAIKHGAPLMVASMGACISDASLLKLRAALQPPNVASACCTSNEGGTGVSFLSPPNNPQFASIDSEAAEVCENVCAKSGLPDREIVFPLGPIVLLSPFVLAKLPQSAEELWDWGFLAKLAGHKNVFVPSAWASAAQPRQGQAMAWLEIRGLNPFLVQGVLDVMDRIRLEANFVRDSHSFVVGTTAGDAATWADIYQPESDAQPQSVRVIQYHDEVDIDSVEEEWLRFAEEHLSLRRGIDARMEKIGNATDADVVYCDAFGPKSSHFFKPATFDIDWFLAFDYVSGCCLIRTKTLQQLLAKVAKRTLSARLELFGYLIGLHKSGGQFAHCNYIGYNELEQPADEGRVKLIHYLLPDYTARASDSAGLLSVSKKLHGKPTVSIIMLTSGKTWTLRQCLATLLRRTEYPGEIEVLIGRMGEKKGDPATLKEVHDSRVTLFELGDDFNWSTGNNALVCHAKGDFLVFMNDDCLVTDKDWLEAMIAYTQRENTGAVGLRLVYPQNGHVQHVGVYVNQGVAGHILKNTPPQWPGYWGLGRITHEATAVTGACLAVKRSLYHHVGGFREDMAVNYNDVAFCLALHQMGLRNICVCTKEMMHAESSSRPHAMTAQWAESIGDLDKYYPEFVDPYWNPSLKVMHNPPKWAVGGLNYDTLDWHQTWRGTALVLNGLEADKLIELSKRHIKPVLAAAEKGRLMFIRPGLMNAPAIEIGEKTLITDVLNALGVTDWYEINETPECKPLKECFDRLAEAA